MLCDALADSLTMKAREASDYEKDALEHSYAFSQAILSLSRSRPLLCAMAAA